MSGFSYTAEQFDGTPVRGAIEADDLAAAEAQLVGMNLRVLELKPITLPARPTRLGVNDLQTFNEFLLQISAAGLPVEGGLESLSRELRSGPLRRAVDELTNDLRAGVPLEKAIADRRHGFPPLYGHLIDAGVQTGDLPGVLGRFGRHAQTVADLRESLWRAVTYPAVVLVALLLLLSFLGYGVLPKYFDLVTNMRAPVINYYANLPGPTPERPPIMLPAMAWAILYLGRLAPFILAVGALAIAAGGVAYGVLRAGGRERGLIDALTRVPVIGRALRDSYVASWLEVAAIGAAAGMDLPRALRLAGDAVALPSLQRDTDAIIERIEAGQAVGGAAVTRLPATVPMAIDIARGPGQLPAALRALAEQFEGQARRQIALVPGRVMPALLVAIGLIAGGILYSLWVPLTQVLAAIT